MRSNWWHISHQLLFGSCLTREHLQLCQLIKFILKAAHRIKAIVIIIIIIIIIIMNMY